MNEEKNENSEIPPITDDEAIPKNHSSHLRNKYMEDIESEAAANNLADLIVHFEKGNKNQGKNSY